MTEPLVCQGGAAATAFEVAVVGWPAFELAMGVRQRRRVEGRLARGPTAFVLSVLGGGRSDGTRARVRRPALRRRLLVVECVDQLALSRERR